MNTATKNQAGKAGAVKPHSCAVKFRKLRGAIAEAGIEHRLLAESVGMGGVTFSRRLNGHQDWSLSEMYAVMDALCLPHSELGRYFPEGGLSVI